MKFIAMLAMEAILVPPWHKPKIVNGSWMQGIVRPHNVLLCGSFPEKTVR